MLVTEILRAKGTGGVVTVTPDSTVAELLSTLAEHGIGAAVVSPDGAAVAGIVSERDVVRALAARGAGVLDEPVSTVATTDVATTGTGARLEELMATMTERRFRHLPVVVDGALTGIVSIGDVVKHRMIELESEREALAGYIATGG